MTKIVKNKKQQQNIQPARRVCYAGTLNKLTILLLPVIAEDSITPPPIAERSIVMTVSVCLSAIISPELHVPSSLNVLCMLPMAVARSYSGGVVIRYVLPVLWKRSYLLISQDISTSPSS